MNGIIRVFPRRTKATPDDVLALTTSPTKAFLNTLENNGGEVWAKARERLEVAV